MSEAGYLILLLVYGIAEQAAGLRLRKRILAGEAGERETRLFLFQAWLLIAAGSAVYMNSHFDLPLGRLPPTFVATGALFLPAIWYWAKYQIGILPGGPALLPRCPHCGGQNPVERETCQWCRKPLQ